jgi:hypothetical protein
MMMYISQFMFPMIVETLCVCYVGAGRQCIGVLPKSLFTPDNPKGKFCFIFTLGEVFAKSRPNLAQ